MISLAKSDASVALKFLPAAQVNDPKWFQQIQHEVTLARRVRNDYVCAVYDLVVPINENCGPFIVMQLVKGEDFNEVFAKHAPVSEKRALQYAHQLATGLRAIHMQDVLHRDLKPSNVVLERSGIKIVDFGLAVLRSAVPSGLAGTPSYMAPELWEGRPPSTASDIYAMGLILRELITGERIVGGAQAEGQSPHQTMTLLAPKVSPELCRRLVRVM